MTIRHVIECDWCGFKQERNNAYYDSAMPYGWFPYPKRLGKHVCQFCYETQDLSVNHG